jgi:EAL domain-containing protein (putative c-di-GMP-specific phosphodiesterase class I)/ActR/RegA family two-component response regulator
MPFSYLRVLLVDDDEFLLSIMLSGLREIGVGEVVTATNGEHALSLLEQGDVFDVILTDLNMPEMDGIELMRHLSGRGYSGDIVLLTAEHPKVLQTANSLAKAHNLRLLGVLQKPFTRDSLVAVLGNAENVNKPFRPKPQPAVTAGELETAIQEGQLVPYFQPRIRIADRSVVGMEALARWQHPEKGLVMPGVFIPLAEQSGLIEALSHLMLKASIEQLGVWQESNLELKISANVTAGDMLDIGLPDRISQWCQDACVDPAKIVLELTESQLMENVELTLDTLIRLRLKGMTLAVDDFGTGYSNLGQIKRAPFSELKIDRSFVREAGGDDEGKAILNASTQLGKQLGLTVVAEGVETQAEWEAVSSYGADEVQGYLVAAAMPAQEVPAWIDKWNCNAGDVVVSSNPQQPLL